ncbi:MAG: DEAD/DEAH box helicase [Parcubacteria group bacterium]|nr:DEAD/DEAH box helicase [Parcubacteria group bacterium]
MKFNDLKLKQVIEKAIAARGYKIPTPIQEKSIPNLLKGKDLIGIAQTGTGKTAAFALPILDRMQERHPRTIQTLVLAPTRELATQIGESFFVYGKFLDFKHTVIFGGVKQGRQVKSLSRGVDILIATPGRLLDLMNQGLVKLSHINFFVLDEADKMLDMGFIHDIKKVVARLPKERQSIFFSATMPPTINNLANSLLKNPIRVEAAVQATTVETVKQYVLFVDKSSKKDLLLKLLKNNALKSVLIFTRTKHKANNVAEFLSKNNIEIDALHGNKSQGARTRTVNGFKNGRIKVLVATDIAARGIDMSIISHVVNFDLPNESESYVHRIGRTARAGAEGTAFSFCSAEERNYLRNIERLIRQDLIPMEHSLHSETARSATGAAAKPPTKNNFRRNSRSNYKSRSNSKNYNRNR